MRPVSRKPMGRWKEFKRKCCQILLNLSELLRVEERQWEECFCEDFCVQLQSAFLFQLPLSLPSCPSTYSCPVCLSVRFCVSSVCRSAAASTHRLFLNLQPCLRLLSPPTMLTSTLRPRPMTRSTVASRGPRSSWRSGTATAWRGWVTGSGRDESVMLLQTLQTTPPAKHARLSTTRRWSCLIINNFHCNGNKYK